MRLAIFGFLALNAFGQFSIKKAVEGDVMTVTYTRKAPISNHAVAGRPYSGVVVWQQTRILSNGAQRAYPPTITKLWRDSEGRGRSEEAMPQGNGRFVLTDVTDSVAGYMYVLDDVNRVAHRTSLSVYPEAEQKSHHPLPAAELVLESLGTRMIEGMLAEGTRETNTFPNGEIWTSESWWSPELKRPMLGVSNDPKNGVRSARLTNVVKGEQAAALFQVPADYSIRDDGELFTVTLKRQ